MTHSYSLLYFLIFECPNLHSHANTAMGMKLESRFQVRCRTDEQNSGQFGSSIGKNQVSLQFGSDLEQLNLGLFNSVYFPFS